MVYINSSGAEIDPSTMNPDHLVNALIKSVTHAEAAVQEGYSEPKIKQHCARQIEVLKAEILKRIKK